MAKKQAKHLIGIDLGTTNCTLAYVEKETSEIKQFAISQIARPGEEEPSLFFPSFIYFPLEEELKAGSFKLTWDEHASLVIGLHAKTRADECPDRVIASAKSWLCHYGIDRKRVSLPVLQEEFGLSPVNAIGELLKHFYACWNHQMEDAFLDQEIIITVPASFDPSARQLVEEAAKIAGYKNLRLLEEPQAAFYAWLHRHENIWRELLKVGDRILIVDIGGGTTDFSLISVDEKEGSLSLERVAVGSHLLLGGDNLDYALSYFIKDELEAKGCTIDDWQFAALKAAAGKAKEALLSEDGPESYPVTIMGRGRRLIGGSITYDLQKQAVEELLVDGFFPNIPFGEKPFSEMQSAFQEKGLPFAKDPRVTAQLASFLSSQGGALPTAVLFNGGTMKSAKFRNRLLDVLNSWASETQQAPIKLLGGEDYDFAVSLGAVYYGLALSGKAIRIRSSLSQSYFIGIEEAMPAIPGRAPSLNALCIAPYGMEEGTEASYENREFALTIGEKVFFRFFCSNCSTLAPKMGTTIRNWKGELIELPPVETLLAKDSHDEKLVFVTLKAQFTELGVLKLFCQEKDGRDWILEFNLREEEETAHR